MRKTLLFYITVLLSTVIIAQENTLFLKSGTIILSNDIVVDRDNYINYHFMIFSKTPTDSIKKNLEKLGIIFLEYIPHKTYVVSVPKDINPVVLSDFGILVLAAIKPNHKIDPKLQDNNFPAWSLKDNKLSVKVLLYKNANISFVQEYFKSINYKIDAINIFSNSITITIGPSELFVLSTINEVWYIEPIDPPSEKENKTGRTLHRSNTINTNYSSGRHYNGSNINIMMQDDGIIGPHIDYQGRIDQSNCGGCSTSNSDDHGDHVAGTIMGSGNLDPIAVGMSNAAFLYVYSSSNNNYYNVPTIYQNNDVIITSKSYSNGCNAGYTSLAKDLDEQINLYPSLIHVFSAGNDGNSDCGYGAGSGWGNVTGGHKQAKNVIAVANLTSSGTLAGSSSRGPAADGRIKPDIGGKGSSVNSTIPVNNYGLKTGTSMSCPGIAGVMGQLYQAYKELNGGQNPNSSIMKNAMLNAADDIGNPGPDFKHGWGEVNILRAVTIIEDNQYLIDSIDQGGSNTHSITIPSGTKKVKLMVYWHDKEASVNASSALVNDLDIELFDNSGTSIELPWILDTTATQAALNSNATKGVDNINNMEQISMDNPPLGNYSLMVSGTSIPFGPQEYSLTYVFISDEITLTYPIGGEGWVPSESEIIRWDTYGTSGNFTLEYTTDGGVSWTTISSNINGSSRQFTLTSVPNVVTDNAKIRISRNGISDESDAYFTIVKVPQNIIVNWICPDSIYVLWNTVNGATEYEVSMLGNVYMDSMTTTTNLTALIVNPNPSITDSWFSVCAKVNNSKGRRAIAVNAQPINNGCIAPPIAGFSAISTNSCTGTISFVDSSMNQPNSWIWNFGDGNTSTIQHPTHTYLQQGTYDVSLQVSNGLGQDSILHAAYITVNFMPEPIAYNDTSCGDSASFSLTAASNNVRWYADTLATSVLQTGSPFLTPYLSSSTTYYIREFGGSSVYGGPIDNTIGGGDYYNNDRHLFIDCYTPSTLVSTDVYAGTAQSITFELRDNNSQVIDDTTMTLQLGLNTLYLDFDIPIMNDLELGMNSANFDLYRNSSGAAYPYAIGTLAAITGHNSPNSVGYHYFFYNIQMYENCLSDYAAVEGILLPSVNPVITQNGTVLSVPLIIGQMYQWYVNGTLIVGATQNTYTVATIGTYQVEVTENGCSGLAQEVVIETIITEQYKETLLLFPNPTSSKCSIRTTKKIKQIKVFDVSARLCIVQHPNSNAIVLDIRVLSKGIYTVEVTTEQEIFRKKLIIE